MAAQFGAARLLYGMGKANALPRRMFAAIDARTEFPATTSSSWAYAR